MATISTSILTTWCTSILTCTTLAPHAFVGPRPDGMVVEHINAIKTDNRVANLRYLTPQETQVWFSHQRFLSINRVAFSDLVNVDDDDDDVIEDEDVLPPASDAVDHENPSQLLDDPNAVICCWQTVGNYCNSLWFSDYETSNLGHVKRISTGHILAQSTNIAGYKAVRMQADGGNWYNIRVHRAVCWAFKADDFFEEAVVDHRNSNKADNSRANLQWVTTQENIALAIGKRAIVFDDQGNSMGTDFDMGRPT
ncbi:His-Me finger endonuclease [Hesseltinella vesiculosa]|uniref:His-Me finger endonuclease n=1 Tax=Hesseltinella vesiculosa TaxID=101127 RepID=A0A1X2GNC9_9FUNG|nr:His-Me finger endonuclease [Hesseltinella vesiculosa]